MELFIRPLDTQFYRSSLPFDAGIDSAAFSNFPPWPRPIYGALRAEAFRQNGVSLSQNLTESHPVLGNKEKFGSLAIKGPFLVQWDKEGGEIGFVYLPFPSDLVKEKDRVFVRPLVPDEQSNLSVFSNLREPSLFALKPQFEEASMVQVEEVEGFFLKSGLSDYLCGELKNERLGNFAVPSAKIYSPEPRVGIKLSPQQRTAETGMIYQVWHYRLNVNEDWPFGFYVKLEGYKENELHLPSQGILRLGGEGRPAAYYLLDNPSQESASWWELPRETVINKIAQSGKFKAYLITPAIFKNGAMPDICTISSGEIKGSIKLNGEEYPFILCGAAIGKSQKIGGWDIQNKCPKVMRQAVPAGSLYFFKFEKWPEDDQERRSLAEAVWKEFNFQSWCQKEPWNEQEPGPGKEGFGIVLIGGW